MKTLFKIHLLVLSLTALTFSARAQQLYNKVVPPSPEAASLGKFIDQPVDYYRGTPKIDVPLWVIEQNGLSIPISLSYHAGGIKVEEIASSVGIGWALNAGGSIFRTLNGAPDDCGTGFVHTTANIKNCPQTWQSMSELLTWEARGDNDWQPDEFSYTCPAGAGRFVFDEDGNVHQIPKTSLKINFFTPNQAGVSIVSEDGTIYEFKKEEQATSSAPYNSYGVVHYTGAWHLTTIRFPGGNPATDITFEYEQYSTTVTHISSETRSLPISDYGSSQSLTIQNAAWRLSKINFASGSINFIAGGFRADLKGGQVLGSVVVRNKNNEIIKSYKFNYNYLGGTDFVSGTANANTTADTGLRLSLKSIQELDNTNSSVKPSYQFFYETTNTLPDRLQSKAMDHWGYYNGHDYNTTLIPRYAPQGGELYHLGGDRHPDENFSKTGILNKIVYPTGSYTSFTYEGHQTNGMLPLAYKPVYLNYSIYIRQCDIQAPQVFTVNDVSGGLDFDMGLKGVAQPQTITCGSNLKPIVESDNSTYLFFRIYEITNPQSPVLKYVSSGMLTITGTSKNYQETLHLPNGKYQIKVYKQATGAEAVSSDATINGVFTFTLSGIQWPPVGFKPAGGVRVKEIAQYDPVTQSNMVKVFKYLDDSGNSSGVINLIPKYDYRKYGNGTIPGDLGLPVYLYTSTSNTTKFDDGVGYSKVTVYEGKNVSTQEIGMNGKTDYYYSVNEDYIFSYVSYDADGSPTDPNATSLMCFKEEYLNSAPPSHESYGAQFPFVPPVSLAWRRGLLEREITYAKTGSAYSKRTEVINAYKDDYYGSLATSKVNRSTDVVAGKAFYVQDPRDGIYIISIMYYYYPSRLVKLIKTENIVYDSNGANPISSIVDYSYDNLTHLQLSKSISTLSNGNKRVTRFTYPDDYTNANDGTFIAEMKSAHVLKPVEKVTYVTDAAGSNVRVTGGDITTYKVGSLIGLPDKLYQFQSASPITTTFTLSNGLTLPSGGVASTFGFKSSTYHSTWANYLFDFDSFRNIAQVQKDSDIPTAYYWGYNNAYPVIKATGISQADLISAVQSLLGASTIETKLDNDWVNFVSSLQSHSKLKQALVTIYGYKPLIGITKVADENGLTTYYTYDSSTRLKVLQDNDKNIRKTFDYHYMGGR